MKLFTIALCFALCPAIAWANPDNSSGDWNDACLQTAHAWNENPAYFSDPYAASVWGVLKADQASLSSEEELYSTVHLRSQYYGKKQRAYLKTQKQGNSPFTRNAPLLVILPGIFSAAFDGNELAKAEKFYALGYHVLILNNPWSVEAISKYPTMKPGTLETEAKWVLESVQTAIDREVNPKYVSSVTLYGESYGAMLAGMAAGLDDPNQPVVTGKVILASPPLNLNNAYVKLDQIYDETSEIAGMCEANKIRIGMNFLRAHSQQSLHQESIDCAKNLVAVTFNHSLKESLKELQKTGFGVDGPYEVKFQYYVEHFAPDIKTKCDANPETCTLAYWVKKAIGNGKRNIDIVSSKDDFLNSVTDWNDIHTLLPHSEKQLILLNWGGHLGYNGSKTYTQAFYTN